MAVVVDDEDNVDLVVVDEGFDCFVLLVDLEVEKILFNACSVLFLRAFESHEMAHESLRYFFPSLI